MGNLRRYQRTTTLAVCHFFMPVVAVNIFREHRSCSHSNILVHEVQMA